MATNLDFEPLSTDLQGLNLPYICYKATAKIKHKVNWDFSIHKSTNRKTTVQVRNYFKETAKAQQSKSEKESPKHSGYHESGIEMEASRSQGQKCTKQQHRKSSAPQSAVANDDSGSSTSTPQRGEIFAAVCLVVNRTIANVCPLQRIGWERDSSGVCICCGDFSSLRGVRVGVIVLSLKTHTQQSVSTRTETVFPPLFDFPPHKANRLS